MKIRNYEFIVSVIIMLIPVGIYYYFFGYADRRVVFLYDHLGFTPFDQITAGRYWMAGFITSGFLSVLYLILQLAIRILKLPVMSWKKVFTLMVIPLNTGIIIIVMTAGEPELGLFIAISSALALTAGIFLGFSLVDNLMTNVKSTSLFLLFGLGMVPSLILFKALELPGKGILAFNVSLLIAVISVTAGLLWLLTCHWVFRKYRPKWPDVVKGALVTAYLGLPVLHYLAATPKGIPYITSADNFFADNMILRLITWMLLFLFVFSTDKLMRRFMP